MSKDNCLSGLACPACGYDRRLLIEVTTLADVTDDGAEAFGDMAWGDESYAECPDCRYAGRLSRFRTPHLPETKE